MTRTSPSSSAAADWSDAAVARLVDPDGGRQDAALFKRFERKDGRTMCP